MYSGRLYVLERGDKGRFYRILRFRDSQGRDRQKSMGRATPAEVRNHSGKGGQEVEFRWGENGTVEIVNTSTASDEHKEDVGEGQSEPSTSATPLDVGQPTAPESEQPKPIQTTPPGRWPECLDDQEKAAEHFEDGLQQARTALSFWTRQEHSPYYNWSVIVMSRLSAALHTFRENYKPEEWE